MGLAWKHQTFKIVLFCLSLALPTHQKFISVSDLCNRLPSKLQIHCKCDAISSDLISADGISLVCKNLADLDKFLLDNELDFEVNPNSIVSDTVLSSSKVTEELKGRLIKIVIKDSNLQCIQLTDIFRRYKNLQYLTITRSNLQNISNCGVEDAVLPERPLGADPESKVFQKKLSFAQHPKESSAIQQSAMESLQLLDLSFNMLKKIDKNIMKEFPALKELNVSVNQIDFIAHDFFKGSKNLRVVDLSSNKLDQTIDPQAFHHLPKNLQYIDFSNNSWTCSPQLAWIYDWALPYIASGAIAKLNITRCHYEGSTHDARLILVMEYYTKHVLPSCPVKDHCQCFLENIQEKIVVSTERHYAVFVSCPNKGLSHFPKLPKHTRTLDLSGNKLSNVAFNHLKVIDHNYNEVENLTLNNNLLETLPESLLEMKLGIRFSAKSNQLSSIPYDFSQHLLKTTNVIELSDNPWICTCTSQITDLNLLSKIRDRKYMFCGVGSDVRLLDKQIFSIDPEVLCPPDTNDESQELLLQFLCVLLTVLIVALLSKLSYDAWIYRTRGQLPWLVLKMP